MEEIDEVLKVYVDKSESFMDEDNIRWNSVDIFLNTTEDAEKWEDTKFRKRIFSRCFLWGSYKTFGREYTRGDVKKRIEERGLFEMRSRGYYL
jgi:hypothetical protein